MGAHDTPLARSVHVPRAETGAKHASGGGCRQMTVETQADRRSRRKPKTAMEAARTTQKIRQCLGRQPVRNTSLAYACNLSRMDGIRKGMRRHEGIAQSGAWRSGSLEPTGTRTVKPTVNPERVETDKIEGGDGEASFAEGRIGSSDAPHARRTRGSVLVDACLGLPDRPRFRHPAVGCVFGEVRMRMAYDA